MTRYVIGANVAIRLANEHARFATSIRYWLRRCCAPSQSTGIVRRSPIVRSARGKASEPARTHHSITS